MFVATLAGTTMLPFFPAFWAPLLALAAGAIALRFPRAGLALALAAPVFPLGNLALGLALMWGALGLAWLVLSWRDARAGLAFLSGPVLAAVGLIGLVPLAVQPARGHVRRAAQTLAAVGAAALAAGLRGSPLPLGQGEAQPLDLAGSDSAVQAGAALVEALPVGLVLGALVLAAAAVAIPYATTPWRIAALGAGLLALTVLVVPAAPVLPLVAAAWLTCAALVARASRVRTAPGEH